MWIRTDEFLDIHDCYLAAVGRGLLLAQNFEENCKYVLLIWDLGDAFKSGVISNAGELPAYSNLLLKRFLGPVVKRFGSKYGIKPEQYKVLEKARNARNYLAHEGATPCLYYRHPEAITEALPLFKRSIGELAEGDNLVSGWSYMIQEKELPPYRIKQQYCDQITAYILEPLEQYLETGDSKQFT